MAEFVVRCPQCNTKLQVQDEWGGMEVECAKCKNIFAIPKQDSNTPASPVYTCTQCKKEYSKMTKFCSECGGKVEEVNSTPPVYACVQCKKAYSEMTKFCSECGGKVEKVKTAAKAETSDTGNELVNWLGGIAVLVGIPLLLYWLIDWPRTIFWCTLPAWGVCLLGLCGNKQGKLAVLVLAGIIWWGYDAHTQGESEDDRIYKIGCEALGTAISNEMIDYSIDKMLGRSRILPWQKIPSNIDIKLYLDPKCQYEVNKDFANYEFSQLPVGVVLFSCRKHKKHRVIQTEKSFKLITDQVPAPVEKPEPVKQQNQVAVKNQTAPVEKPEPVKQQNQVAVKKLPAYVAELDTAKRQGITFSNDNKNWFPVRKTLPTSSSHPVSLSLKKMRFYLAIT